METDLLDIILEKFSKSLMRKNKGVGVLPNINPDDKNNIITNYFRTKQDYKKDLTRNFRQFINGDIDKDEYLVKQKNAIDTAFKTSFLLGKVFSQSTETKLTSDEVKSIIYQVSQEMKFMRQFADDIINSEGRMNYTRRLQMYVDGLDALFTFGRIAFLPEEILLNWELGATDKHCIDCLIYAAQSPYTKRNLPTVPKSGDTSCLSNCLCSLVIVGGDNNIDFVFKNYAPSKGFNIPDESNIEYLEDLRDRFYYLRGMSRITGDDFYKEYGDNLRQEYHNHIKQNRLAINANLPVSRYLKEISLFMNNEKFQIDNNSLNIGDVVSLFNSGKQIYARINKVDVHGIEVKGINGGLSMFNFSNTIIFRRL